LFCYCYWFGFGFFDFLFYPSLLPLSFVQKISAGARKEIQKMLFEVTPTHTCTRTHAATATEFLNATTVILLSQYRSLALSVSLSSLKLCVPALALCFRLPFPLISCIHSVGLFTVLFTELRSSITITNNCESQTNKNAFIVKYEFRFRYFERLNGLVSIIMFNKRKTKQTKNKQK